MSSLFEITSESLVDNISQTVETQVPLHVPGVESLVIPSKTRGHVLRVIGGNTVLVRWEVKAQNFLNAYLVFTNCMPFWYPLIFPLQQRSFFVFTLDFSLLLKKTRAMMLV